MRGVQDPSKIFSDSPTGIVILGGTNELWQGSLSLNPCREGAEIWAQPIHPTGDQSWVFIGRTDVEAETPILWPPYVKSWLIGKDPDVRKDEMAGWHHWLDGHGFGWTPGVGDGQGGLVCCGSWGRKESDMTERLNWTNSKRYMHSNVHSSTIYNSQDKESAQMPTSRWLV